MSIKYTKTALGVAVTELKDGGVTAAVVMADIPPENNSGGHHFEKLWTG